MLYQILVNDFHESPMQESHISAAQVRAARAWLEISQEELAAKARVGRRAIADYERGARYPHDRTLDRVRVALEGWGIEFLFEGAAGAGIRIRASSAVGNA